MGVKMIPDDLVEAVAARRVIPFVGAGFSAGLGLPDWDTLLRQVAQEVDSSFTYDEIREMCSGDRLQVAEYFLLIERQKHRAGAACDLASTHRTRQSRAVGMPCGVGQPGRSTNIHYKL